MRRLLLGSVLLALPVTLGTEPSVAGFVTNCYYLAVEIPNPYEPGGRVCPFPPPVR